MAADTTTTLAGRPDVTSAWLRDGRRVARALLVDMEGSAPLPPGATMLVDEQGNVEGSITGGCVEGALVQEAEDVLAGGGARLLTYGVSDELAGSVGLMCGGTVHIFLQELDSEAARVELAALDAVRSGKPAAIATLLDGDLAGAKLVLVDGTVIGTLGLDLLDRNVAREAAGLLDDGRSTLRRFGADGATIGSELRVHIHAFASPPQMLIFGAVDFAAALAPMAKEIGYAVTICDAREVFIQSPRFSRAAELVVSWPQAVIEERTLGPRDAVLVFTHDRKFDEPALTAALATDVGYVGALGSRRTAVERAERLRERGVTDEQLARVHSPCGLDIGSRTAEETAVAVLAEIIATRAARSGRPLRETSGPIGDRRQP